MENTLVKYSKFMSIQDAMKSKLKTVVTALVAFVCFYACGQKESESYGPAEHVVSMEPSCDTLHVSDSGMSGKVLTLSGCTIGRINGAVLIPSGIVLKGKFYTGSGNSKTESEVALFSDDGRFISHVARKGRSGEEVLNVQSVKYNPYKNTLDILADYGRSIVSFDISTWNILNRENLADTDVKVAVDFIPVNDHQYLCYKNLSCSIKKEYKLYLYDGEEKNVVSKFLKLDKKRAELISFSQRNNLSCFSGKILFYESFLKKIFVFSDGKLEPYIEFADNEYQMSEDLLNAGYRDLIAFLDMCKGSGCIWGDVNYYFSGDKVYSMFEYKDALYYNVIDLSSDTSRSYSCVCDNEFLDATVLSKDLVVDIVGSTDDSLLLSVDSYKMLNGEASVDEQDTELNPKLLILTKR